MQTAALAAMTAHAEEILDGVDSPMGEKKEQTREEEERERKEDREKEINGMEEKENVEV